MSKLWLVAQWLMLVLVATLIWRVWQVDEKATRCLDQARELSQRTCVCPDGFFP